jgi:enoyl-CoA hydratase/carnithine racemase
VALENQPLVLAGNDQFFSAGADLNEISVLDAPTAYEFSPMGQTLMTNDQ